MLNNKIIACIDVKRSIFTYCSLDIQIVLGPMGKADLMQQNLVPVIMSCVSFLASATSPWVYLSALQRSG